MIEKLCKDPVRVDEALLKNLLPKEVWSKLSGGIIFLPSRW